ncbi:MAG: PAS domain S-box protein [Terriglobia bacterium]
MISEFLVKSLDIERTLGEVLACCLDAVGTSKGAAYLVESDGGLSLRAQRGYPDSAKGQLADFFGHADLLREVIKKEEPVAVPFSQVAKERATELLARAGATSLLITPLVFGEERLGTLVMVSVKGDLAQKLTLFTKLVRLYLGQAIALARAISLSAASEQRFRDLVQELDAIVWEADAVTWKFSFVSRRAEQILGYPVEQWLTERDFWANHIHPDDREQAVAFCQKATAEGRDHEFEYRALAADGHIVWLRDIVHVVRDEEGRVQQLRGLMVDISERKQGEKRLEERTTYLNALIENSPLAIVVLDSQHRVQMCNPAFERLFRYHQSEIVGSKLDEFIATPKLMGEAVGFTRQVLAGEFVHATTRRRRKDGTLIDVELHGVPLLVHGELLGVFALYQDITERKRGEEALRRSEASYRSLIHGALYGIYRSTVDGKFVEVNPALVEMLGYESAAELLAVNMATDIYWNPDERARLIEQYRHQEHFEGVEVEWKRKDGTPITMRLSGRPVRDEQEAVAYFETITENVTERRVLEDQLRQAQKMEAVGRLAGGVAHDFNNLLMLISGHSGLLLDRLGQSDPPRRHAEEIEKAAEQATSLTRQLLAFSRKQVLQPKLLDLNAVITDMEELLARLIGEDINLAIVPVPAAGQVKADPVQVEQVILNLVLNARDAMPQGGKLTIETANVELDRPYARRHAGAAPGRYVMLAVSDTGPGMDAQTRSQIFEPFFTTKERGKGTGLGLATVYGIVKQSGGYIWVYSEPGQGTTFKIYLPRVEEPIEAEPPSKALTPSPRGSETILVVEDETRVCKLVREFLESSGYTVLEARNGSEALQIAERHAGPIHLMMTDVVMPGMSGRELAERIAPLRPDMRVLYVSGYTDNSIVHHGILGRGTVFLQKPFTQDTLTRKVRELLDAAGHTQ